MLTSTYLMRRFSSVLKNGREYVKTGAKVKEQVVETGISEDLKRT